MSTRKMIFQAFIVIITNVTSYVASRSITDMKWKKYSTSNKMIRVGEQRYRVLKADKKKAVNCLEWEYIIRTSSQKEMEGIE